MRYEIRRRGYDGKEAVFDENGKMISPEWFDWIFPYGLVKGESPYYIAKKNGKYAIFDKNGNMITKEWYDWIWESGLVKGDSEYYVVKKDGKYAIFNKYGKMISPEWFDFIFPFGLVLRESDYYVVVKDNKKSNKFAMAIFDENGNRISEWYSWIYSDGLVKGESDYYLACNGEECAIYHKNGQKVSEDFSREEIKDVKSITFNNKLGIVELFNNKNGNLIKSIEFYPVIQREEIIDYTKLLNI
jgi:antitoxin component YwqK of YwqJK toxin-antitoxin module